MGKQLLHLKRKRNGFFLLFFMTVLTCNSPALAGKKMLGPVRFLCYRVIIYYMHMMWLQRVSNAWQISVVNFVGSIPIVLFAGMA